MFSMEHSQRDINKHKISIKIKRETLIPFLGTMIFIKTHLNDKWESLSQPTVKLSVKHVVPKTCGRRLYRLGNEDKRTTWYMIIKERWEHPFNVITCCKDNIP